MNEDQKKPIKTVVHLNFLGIHFPLTAWVSIMHRLSGFALFLMVPILLWMLQASLQSNISFKRLQIILTKPWCLGFISLLLAAIAYHTVAGIRHLLMDLKIGIGKDSSLKGARWVIVFSILFFLILCKRFL